jgi:ABC-type multidrug transport system fused ATPase/permease subunit
MTSLSSVVAPSRRRRRRVSLIQPPPETRPLRQRLVSYLGELRSMLAGVNRLIFAMDRRYAVYCWISETVAVIPRLATFVIGASIIGSLISTPQMSWTVVLLGIAGYAIYLSATTVVRVWAQERWRIFRDLLATHLELRRVEHLAGLDLGRLVDSSFIELTSLAMRRGFAAVEAVWNLETRLVGALVQLAVSASVLLYLDPLLGLLAAAIAIPNIAQRWLGEQKRREMDIAETFIRRQREETYNAITSPRTSAFMRLLKFTDGFLAQYRALTGILVGNVKVIAAFERRWSFIAGATTVVCIALLGLYFASGLVASKYSYVQIGAIAGSLQMVANALASFGWMVGAFENERRNYAYLEQFFAVRPLVDEAACQPVELTAPPRLTLDNVSFTYPGRTAQATIGVTTVIEPGEKVALVGPNGSGKTTLLRLLSRVYTPSEGVIRADGHDLAVMWQASWIDHMVMATQAPTLPGMEMARALTGKPPEAADERLLRRALQIANADEIVDGLPLGMKTWIGEEWPDGRGFSTGEHQRLALAATLHRLLDEKVFLAMFDEPTANCDAETKARFYDGITHAPEFAGKTVIVSLHDPLYLTFFDRVLQFEDGRLINDIRGKDEIHRYQDEISAALARDL